MKRLTSDAPHRQERWEHNGRHYSIVDLHEPLLEEDEPTRRMNKEHHPVYHWEVAEGSEPLRRYATVEDARDSIETGMCHE